VSSTGKVYMISEIEGIRANLAYSKLDRNGTSSAREDELTPDDLVAARQTLPAASAVAGTYDVPVDFQLGGKSFGGAVVGVVLALGLVWSVTGLIKNILPLGISWMAVWVALIVSSGVGVLFGYRTDSEAANLNPIDALRMERGKSSRHRRDGVAEIHTAEDAWLLIAFCQAAKL
jgi:hypothetical protein